MGATALAPAACSAQCRCVGRWPTYPGGRWEIPARDIAAQHAALREQPLVSPPCLPRHNMPWVCAGVPMYTCVSAGAPHMMLCCGHVQAYPYLVADPAAAVQQEAEAPYVSRVRAQRQATVRILSVMVIPDSPCCIAVHVDVQRIHSACVCRPAACCSGSSACRWAGDCSQFPAGLVYE